MHDHRDWYQYQSHISCFYRAGATQYKCAPPIRTAANQRTLLRGIGEGTIDLVASDHSPAPASLKARCEQLSMLHTVRKLLRTLQQTRQQKCLSLRFTMSYTWICLQ